jgi:ribosomal protein S18 acetylase RimI-like enzyme
VEDPYQGIDFDGIPECFHPFIELERIESGYWLLKAIVVCPEYRGKGFAKPLLREAEKVVKAAGATRISLQVEEINQVAFNTYKKWIF